MPVIYRRTNAFSLSEYDVEKSNLDNRQTELEVIS